MLLILVGMLLLGACTSPTPLNMTEVPVTATIQDVATASPIPAETDVVLKITPALEATEKIEPQEAACPGEVTNPIGTGIADEYEFTSYGEVMTWFCDGAAFEDILVALQTEEFTGTPAEEMLAMLADGLSWGDIWILLDLGE